MTNKEALQAYVNFPLKSQSIDLALINADVAPDDDYLKDNQESVETALVGLILIMKTSPKAVAELDYTLTSQDMDALDNLRAILIARWNLNDELAADRSFIQDATQLWGTTFY